MKRVCLAIMIIVLGVSTTACSSTLSLGQRASDDTHTFSISSAQIIDIIGEDTPLEGEVYLVIKYEVGNLRSQNDSLRQWTDQITLETNRVPQEPILIKSLDNQLWETSLLKNQKRTGYIVFTVPQESSDFRLIFTFPVSVNVASYDFRPADKRIEVNTEHILTRLEQIKRTQEIPLFGGLFARATSVPIIYGGTILVPEDEVPDLLKQTSNLPDDAKKKVIEDYLSACGHAILK